MPKSEKSHNFHWRGGGGGGSRSSDGGGENGIGTSERDALTMRYGGGDKSHRNFGINIGLPRKIAWKRASRGKNRQ